MRLNGIRVDPVHSRFIHNWVRPDSVVWDIGANMGLFSFPAALKARQGKVYGFEPDVELAGNLLRSTRRQRQSLPFSCYSLALSDRDGVASLLISRYGRSMNKLEGVGPWHDDLFVAREIRSVPIAKIDTIVGDLSPPTILKVDVEGAEMQVLRGGTATIAKYRPIMLIEGPQQIWPEMRSFFDAHNYLMLDGGANTPTITQEPTWDTVAVPRESWSHMIITPAAFP
jgi:FkbM family methyltransferase